MGVAKLHYIEGVIYYMLTLAEIGLKIVKKEAYFRPPVKLLTIRQ